MEEIINRALAGLFLIISLPLFLIIPALIKLEQPSDSVFYRGKRLGLRKKEFFIYKFRTLINGAEYDIGDTLLPKNSKLVTAVGRFLRPTRIDEIPQFINVLKGEMNLVGPRPLRPVMYEKYQAHRGGCDERMFTVKPGIFGINQFFTPYHTPQAIRHRIDLQYVSARSIKYDLKLALYIILRMCMILPKEAAKSIYWGVSDKRQPRDEKRRCRRVVPPDTISIAGNGNGNGWISVGQVALLDINDSAMALLSRESLPVGSLCKLKISSTNGHSPRKNARPFYINLYGRVISTRENGIHSAPTANNYACLNIVQFEQISHFNYYKLEKYMLRNSLDTM